MRPEHRRYVLTETAASLLINVALSAAFAWLVFRGRETIVFAGASGFGVDFLAQTFMISLMSVVVPTLLTRNRLRAGALADMTGRRLLPGRLRLRAPLISVIATIGLGGGALLFGAVVLPPAVGFGSLLAIKLTYGAMVALLVTPLALVTALHDGNRQ